MSRCQRLALRLAALVLATQLLAACGETSQPEVASSSPPPLVEARSLLGEPLHRPQLDEEFRSRQEALLGMAFTTLTERPNDPDPIIWVGRRMAYLGGYQRALWTFSRGIDAHPNDARLYRHRGHRYITVRRLETAIADLERAGDLIAGTDDEVEPDGLPNERNIPTSTLHSNIWYHLGLAHYLRHDFERALGAYRSCLEVSKNPDMLVATSYWLYMTLRRLGLEDEAAEVLSPIEADLDIIENHAYHQLLLMARSEGEPEQILAAARADGEASLATTGYGVGAWYLLNGQRDRAFEVFREIVATDAWASFGYIAAEAELAHDRQEPR